MNSQDGDEASHVPDGDGASHVPDGDGSSHIPGQWLQLRQPLPPSDAVSSPTNFPAPTSLSSRLDQRPEQNFRQHQFQFHSGNQQHANQQLEIWHPCCNQRHPAYIRPLASSNFRNGIGLQNLSGDPNRSSSPSTFRRINSSGMPESIPRTEKQPFGNTNAPPNIPNQIPPATGIYRSDNIPNQTPPATGIYGTHNIPNQIPSNFTVMRCPNCACVLRVTKRGAMMVETRVSSHQNRLFQQSMEKIEKIEKMIREQSAALAEVQAAASSREAATLSSSLERLTGKKIHVTGNGIELQIRSILPINRIGNSGDDDKDISGFSNRSSSPLTLRRINSNLMPEQHFQKFPRIEKQVNTNPDHPVPNYQIPEAAESGTERNARNVEMQSDQLKFIAEFFDNQILAHFQQFMEKFETLEREKYRREDMWRAAEAKKGLEQAVALSRLERLVGEEIPVAGNSGASSSGSWLTEEVETLIKPRTQLDEKSRELRRKASTWEEISSGMEILGYKRDAKRCREKWQSITKKYFRNQKDDEMKGIKKTCSYFELLREYYSARKRDPERLLAPEMANNEDPSTSSAHQNNVEEEEEEED